MVWDVREDTAENVVVGEFEKWTEKGGLLSIHKREVFSKANTYGHMYMST